MRRLIVPDQSDATRDICLSPERSFARLMALATLLPSPEDQRAREAARALMDAAALAERGKVAA
jgi:hypothetical protein